jgi:hypothetical protein
MVKKHMIVTPVILYAVMIVPIAFICVALYIVFYRVDGFSSLLCTCTESDPISCTCSNSGNATTNTTAVATANATAKESRSSTPALAPVESTSSVDINKYYWKPAPTGTCPVGLIGIPGPQGDMCICPTLGQTPIHNRCQCPANSRSMTFPVETIKQQFNFDPSVNPPITSACVCDKGMFYMLISNPDNPPVISCVSSCPQGTDVIETDILGQHVKACKPI